MNCKYCFYKDETTARQTACYGRMSDETAQAIIQKTLGTAEDAAAFIFQGGEPTLCGLSFYRRFAEIVRLYNHKSLRIDFAIQTNGLLLDDNWCEFFAQNHFLVGLSLDGPRDVHDRNRLLSDGSGSFQSVMRAVRLLQAHNCEFNILSVVTNHSEADKIHHFFRKNNLLYQQYIPFISPINRNKGTVSLSAGHYGSFLKQLFDLWYTDVINGVEIHNRTFENWCGMLAGIPPESCGMCGHCQPQYVVEADGGIYPCDFYVLDQFRCGNLITDSFEKINEAIKSSGFLKRSLHIDSDCRNCRYFSICRGGCRRYREPAIPDQPLQKNILCTAYYDFFSYAYKRMYYLSNIFC